MKTFTWISVLVLAQYSLTLFAGGALHSARRYANDTAKHAESQYWERIASDAPAVRREGSASASKKPFAELSFDSVVTSPDVTELFTNLRDEQFLLAKSKPDFFRRLSWLYPQDGCWIRAALMKQLSIKWKQGAPHKLFIFGNLKVNTANAPGGSVSWWYHVVPLVRDDAGQPMVLDPAINSAKPLPIKEWILTQVPELEKAEYSLCSPETYNPSSQCLEPAANEDKLAPSEIETYLESEWQNLTELGRDPEKELGDLPPWGN